MREKGINAAAIQFCSHENVPIDLSATYKTLKDELGEEKATQWTYWATISMPDVTLQEIMEV